MAIELTGVDLNNPVLLPVSLVFLLAGILIFKYHGFFWKVNFLKTLYWKEKGEEAYKKFVGNTGLLLLAFGFVSFLAYFLYNFFGIDARLVLMLFIWGVFFWLVISAHRKMMTDKPLTKFGLIVNLIVPVVMVLAFIFFVFQKAYEAGGIEGALLVSPFFFLAIYLIWATWNSYLHNKK